MKLSDIFRKTRMSNDFRRVFANLVDNANDGDILITLSIVDYKKEGDRS